MSGSELILGENALHGVKIHYLVHSFWLILSALCLIQSALILQSLCAG